MSARTVVSIGTFDGVHVGHAAICRRAREIAGPEGRVVVLSFDPHPISLLRPSETPPRLTTFADRTRLLREAGADEVLRLEPEPALMGLSPRAFLGYVADEFAPVALVEGADFRFGRGRSGNIEGLRTIGRTLGFEVETVDDLEVALGDQILRRASSSLARHVLAAGRMGDAAAVLGRPYELTGEVRPGDRRGRSIGYPTINLRPETMLPALGVYAAMATLPDGRRLPAAVNVGQRPTFGGMEFRVEAHLLDLPTSEAAGAWSPLPGLDEYGWPCRLELSAWLRDQVRFDSVAAITAQLGRDCGRVRAALGLAEVPA